jgi:hypothetical protein
MSTFTTECYQNQYLPLGAAEVNAIVTVTSDGVAGATTERESAEVVIVDTSGSMGVPRRKLESAREATSVAIDCIRDGVAFGVIGGTEHARPVYPTDGTLVPASAHTRAEAKEALRRLKAKGGTAIGSWLTLAGEMFRSAPGASCHALLLTDGENQHESDAQLDGVLSELEGRFQCDCRGVGIDWRVSELRRVASALLGTVDIIAEPEDMAEDFRALMQTAMGKATGNVSLRLWTPQGSSVAFIRQVAPTIEELTGRAVQVDARAADYPTATWGSESRDYHLCINVPPGEAGDEMPRRGGRDRSDRARQGDLDRRPTAVDAHQPRGRSLHRAGRVGRLHPAGSRSPQRGRPRDRDVQARTGRQARRRERERRHDEAAPSRRRGRRRCDRDDPAPPRRRHR